jgi:hypothetical protein
MALASHWLERTEGRGQSGRRLCKARGAVQIMDDGAFRAFLLPAPTSVHVKRWRPYGLYEQPRQAGGCNPHWYPTRQGFCHWDRRTSASGGLERMGMISYLEGKLAGR